MSAPTALDLLWGTAQRPKRGPKPSLTLERIVAEAIEHADAEGLASVSMQRLAERLGCAKMALYRYVPGKAELEALMLDTALGAVPDPAAAAPGAEAPWRAQLRAWAMTMFERMLAHPWAHEVAQGARPVGPNEVGWMESALTALADSGLTGAEGLDTIALLAGHVRSLALQAAAAGDDSTEAALGRQVSQALAAQADRYPRTAAAFTESGPPGDRDNALDFGIDRILDGLGALIAARARRPEP
ncbi:MAG TPA: TetR/AcrR family transcriptional regulator C-terminal domain-containing protein [Trebonia sp.]|nr:TetR/AcrR family transcriptional regulator C-terminal domain-containing protein [Trebonia sp.]